MATTKGWIGRPMKRVEDTASAHRARHGISTTMPFPALATRPSSARPTPTRASAATTCRPLSPCPGVAGVITGADVAERTKPFGVGVTAPVRYYCAATDKVRFVGEPVAVVVARDRYSAEDAAERVVVHYEPLPAVVDPEKALEPDAPILHEAVGTNLANSRRLVYGDPDGAFRDAEMVIRERFRFPKYGSTPIETYAIVACWDPFDQILTVWSNFMGPFIMHPLVARVLQLPENRLRFIVPPDIGGSYGIKSSIYPYIALIGLTAMKTGVTVKWIEDRREHLLASSSGTDRVAYREVAARRDGTVLGMRYRWYRQRGRLHPEPRARLLLSPARQLRRPLSLPAPRGRGRHGDDQQEPHRAQPRLRLWPPLLRDRAHDGSPRREARPGSGGGAAAQSHPHGVVSRTGRPREASTTAATSRRPSIAPWRSRNTTSSRPCASGRAPRGAAWASASRWPSIRPSRTWATWPPRSIPSSAPSPSTCRSPGAVEACSVKVDPLGRLTAVLATTPQGQGHQTVVAQILADELGLDPADITVVDEMDTFTRVWSISSGTYSSRFGSVGTSAVALAGRKLKAKLVEYAAHLMEMPVEQLELRDGAVRLKVGKGPYYTVKDLAGRAHWNTESLPDGMEPGLAATALFGFTEATIGYPGRQGQLVEHVWLHRGGHGRGGRSRDGADRHPQVRDGPRRGHDHQPDDRRGADLWRSPARARRRALRGAGLRRGRAVPDRELHGLRGARPPARRRRSRSPTWCPHRPSRRWARRASANPAP